MKREILKAAWIMGITDKYFKKASFLRMFLIHKIRDSYFELRINKNLVPHFYYFNQIFGGFKNYFLVALK